MPNYIEQSSLIPSLPTVREREREPGNDATTENTHRSSPDSRGPRFQVPFLGQILTRSALAIKRPLPFMGKTLLEA
jgi:hypothetical protein